VILLLGSEQFAFEPRQLKFFEAPSYYTYSELRDLSDTARIFRWASTLVDWMLTLLYLVAFPATIGYFISQGIRESGSWWLIAPYSVSAFLALFSSGQYFEGLRPKPHPGGA
jgi:hypothetical protein